MTYVAALIFPVLAIVAACAVALALVRFVALIRREFRDSAGS